MIFGPKIDFFLNSFHLVTRDFAARSPELSGFWKDSSGLYDRDTTDLVEHSAWQNLYKTSKIMKKIMKIMFLRPKINFLEIFRTSSGDAATRSPELSEARKASIVLCDCDIVGLVGHWNEFKKINFRSENHVFSRFSWFFMVLDRF